MSTETHASRAYQHLRNKLIAGQFAPGERLLYGPIGKEIGVSATPVREAAGQLANEGLVELVPQLGAVVRRIDRDELIEIYEVRLAIEPYAARLAAQRASEKHLHRLAAEMNRMKQLAEKQSTLETSVAGKQIAKQFDKADYSFHMTIIAATHNRAMIRTAGQSHVLTRVFGIRRHQYDAHSMLETCREHAAILDAIQASSPDSAAAAAAAHIQHGLEISLKALDSPAGRKSAR
ncbi:MAG: GntR family transcriptional regulator [Planctomycetaceae bacterium]|nr:GntR family transcriptional regulator [Planctomycetaceae bacterium]